MPKSPSKDTPWKINGWNLQIYHPFFRKENDHREFQVPKNGGTEPYKAVLGVGFPLHQPLHTAFIGEDSSILGTWNVWWWSSNPTSGGTGGTSQVPASSLPGLQNEVFLKALAGTFLWAQSGGTGGVKRSSSVDAEGSWGWKRFGMTGNDRFIKYKIKLQEISA